MKTVEDYEAIRRAYFVEGQIIRDEGYQGSEGGIHNYVSQQRKGRKSSVKDKSELYIHGKDGKIQHKDSHDGDPYPPEG